MLLEQCKNGMQFGLPLFLLAAANRREVKQPWSRGRIYELFPRLAERRRSMGA